MYNHRPKYRQFLYVLLASFVLAFFVANSSGLAADGELAAVNDAIKAKKARWVAGETSVSKLSPEARKKRVGALKPVLSEEDHKAAAEEQAALAALTAPPSYDWRQADGTSAANYVTPVKNQGNCGSCWAFATTAALESQVLLSNNTPGVDLNLSEQTLVSCGNAGNCGGGYPSAASDYLRDLGLPVESCYSYTATNGTCASACADWTNSSFHIAGWHYATTYAPTVDSLKSALATYGPLSTTMDVYSDFFYYTSGVYIQTSGTYQGGHAILIVGYDDAGQYFTVKNSWGTGWGEAGFFRIAYSQLTGPVYFAHYTIAYEGANPNPPPPPPPPPAACTYSISPTGQTSKATGGSGTITVSSQSNCAWTAVSNVAWIAVNSGNTGSGSVSVTFTVAANGTTRQRSGTLTVAGQTFTVKQQALKKR
jgi:C1A family cysteine protease